MPNYNWYRRNKTCTVRSFPTVHTRTLVAFKTLLERWTLNLSLCSATKLAIDSLWMPFIYNAQFYRCNAFMFTRDVDTSLVRKCLRCLFLTDILFGCFTVTSSPAEITVLSPQLPWGWISMPKSACVKYKRLILQSRVAVSLLRKRFSLIACRRKMYFSFQAAIHISFRLRLLKLYGCRQSDYFSFACTLSAISQSCFTLLWDKLGV